MFLCRVPTEDSPLNDQIPVQGAAPRFFNGARTRMNDGDDGECTPPDDVMKSLGRLMVVQGLVGIHSEFEFPLDKREHHVILLYKPCSVFLACVMNQYLVVLRVADLGGFHGDTIVIVAIEARLVGHLPARVAFLHCE